MAKNNVGCGCETPYPVCRDDVNPNCPVHGGLLAHWCGEVEANLRAIRDADQALEAHRLAAEERWRKQVKDCTCGSLPINRADINPSCPLHGDMLAIWPLDVDQRGLNVALSDPSILPEILNDPETLKRLTDPTWLRRAADYLEQSEETRPNIYEVIEEVAEFLNISVVDVQIWEPGCTCHESPAVIEEDISPDCPLHGFEDDEFLSMADNPAWCERTNTIQYRVYKAIKKTGLRCLVSYAAYPNEKDEDGLPIDNLDVVATPQRIVLIYGPSKYFGTGQRYISTILEAPTWLDLAVCANTAIHVTGDRNHIFFEDIMVVDEDSLKPATRLKMERLNVDRIYRLCMGS